MNIGLNKRPLVVSWDNLKVCMHARFVPPHFRKDLLLKLQRLHQGTLSMDAYFKELETLLTKVGMHESEESKMARFVRGLTRQIQDVVELYEYSSLEKLVHLAIKVESQLSKKSFSKTTHSGGYYHSSWKNTNKTSSKIFVKESTSKSRVSQPSPSLPKSPTKTSSKICFKCLGYGHIASNCPSKHNMMVHEGVVMSNHSSQKSNSLPSLKNQSEDECELPCEGDLLVIRRMLGQIQQPFDERQWENIFHTRCLINNKLCSLIVDRGSCTNVASTRVVDKLGLSITSHAKPYKLQWLSKEWEILVNKQVLVNFSIGKYKDEVLCGGVPMDGLFLHY